MKIPRALVGTAVLLAVTTSHGASQVIPGPNGPVEFIGLQQWEAQELFDAIQKLDPDRPFHACAAVMRQDLGFADAAAFLYMTGFSADSERYTVVVGVEDSTRVRYRPTGSETVALPETWENLKTLAGEDISALDAAARSLRSSDDQARGIAEFMGADPETLAKVRDLLGRADGDDDRRLAHEVLARDSARAARAAAILVLANFAADDRSWHALASSLIDSQARVRSVGGGILKSLSMRRRIPSTGPRQTPLCRLSSGGRIRSLSWRSWKSWSLRRLTRSSGSSWFARIPTCSSRTLAPRMNAPGGRRWPF